jgi:hypothetical protein
MQCAAAVLDACEYSGRYSGRRKLPVPQIPGYGETRKSEMTLLHRWETRELSIFDDPSTRTGNIFRIASPQRFVPFTRRRELHEHPSVDMLTLVYT